MFGNDRFRGGDLLASQGERLLCDRLQSNRYRKDKRLAISFTLGSTSRGTAMSMMKSGRSNRSRSIGASFSGLATAFPTLWMVMRISISRHCVAHSSNETARPPTACASSTARSDRTIAHTKIAHTTGNKRARSALAGFTRAQHEHLAIA